MANTAKIRRIVRACALSYKEGNYAPSLKAYGEGHAAEKIIELGMKLNIPIHKEESENILKLVRGLKINENIPAEIYGAVARIFAFIMTETSEKHHEIK